MRLLNPRGRMAFHDEVYTGNVYSRPAIASEQCNRFQLATSRFFDRAPDVFRFAAGADRDQNVAIISKCAHLAGKNFVEAVIITSSGN